MDIEESVPWIPFLRKPADPVDLAPSPHVLSNDTSPAPDPPDSPIGVVGNPTARFSPHTPFEMSEGPAAAAVGISASVPAPPDGPAPLGMDGAALLNNVLDKSEFACFRGMRRNALAGGGARTGLMATPPEVGRKSDPLEVIRCLAVAGGKDGGSGQGECFWDHHAIGRVVIRFRVLEGFPYPHVACIRRTKQQACFHKPSRQQRLLTVAYVGFVQQTTRTTKARCGGGEEGIVPMIPGHMLEVILDTPMAT